MADPNVKAMRAFLAVVTHGTVSEAARQMHITQPALSRMIAGFEADLGFPLFNRVRQRLVPTAEARALARDVERVLISLDEIPTIARDIQAENADTIRIAALPRLAFGLVGPAIKTVGFVHPNTRYVVDIRERREVERWVASRINDLGLVTFPVEHTAIELESFARIPLCVILAAHHPHADREAIALRDLSREPLILPGEGTMTRKRIDRAFAEANRRPHAVIECPSSVLACQFVAQGLGYSLSDAIATALNPGTLRAIPIEPGFEIQLGFVSPRGKRRMPLTEALRDAIRDTAIRYGAQPHTAL